MQKMPAPLRFVAPMDCQPVEAVSDGGQWQYELKLDGYRAIAVKDAGKVSLYSRSGHSFNAKFPAIVRALEQLRSKRAPSVTIARFGCWSLCLERASVPERAVGPDCEVWMLFAWFFFFLVDWLHPCQHHRADKHA